MKRDAKTSRQRVSAVSRLDRALWEIRHLWDQPSIRKEFLGHFGEPISLSVFGALRLIEARIRDGSKPSITDVAADLGLDASVASRMISRAVDLGYVNRAPSPADRRRIELSLTERGDDLLRRGSDSRESIISKLTRAWEPDEIDSLSAVLERLRSELEN